MLHLVSQSRLITSYSSSISLLSLLAAFILRPAVWSHFSPAQGNHFQSEWEFLSLGVVRGQVLDKTDITACDSKRSAITNPQTGEPRVSRLFQDMGKEGLERCAVGRAGYVADLPHHIKSIGGQKEALAWGQTGLTDNFTSGQIGWKD